MAKTELHDVTVVLKDPSVDKVRAALTNLRKMGVAFPTQLNSFSVHGLATAQVIAQLQQARDVLVISRRLDIVEAQVKRSVDAATALREIEDRERAKSIAETEEKLGRKVEDDGEITVYASAPKPQPTAAPAEEAKTEKPVKKSKNKKAPSSKKKTTKNKSPKPKQKPKVKPDRPKGTKKKKNKRKIANKSKRQNRKKRR